MLIHVTVWVSTRRLRKRSVTPRQIRWRAQAMLSAMSLPDAELSILLCDDSTIAKLNAEYRDKAGPTDVLAFPLQEGPSPPSVGAQALGDVVISVPTARRQAKKAKRTIVDEVTFLLAHGLLHLLGYDHDTAAKARIMTDKTQALVAAVSDVSKSNRRCG